MAKQQSCPFCGTRLVDGPQRIRQIGPALYAYVPCDCHVQFDREGYPHRPRRRT